VAPRGVKGPGKHDTRRKRNTRRRRRRRKKSTRRRSSPMRRSMCRHRLRRVVGAKRGRRRMTRQVVTLVVPFGNKVAHDSRIGRYLFRDDH
jgi:hypothetical protein